MNNPNPQSMTAQRYTQICNRQMLILRKEFSGISTPDAEDIMQEAWYSVLLHRPYLLSDDKQLGAYLHKTCVNIANKQYKSVVKYPFSSLDDEKSEYCYGADGSALEKLLSEIENDELQRKKRLHLLRQALCQLSESHLRLLRLYYCHNYSMEEIAEELHLASNDVAKSIKYRILHNLRKQIQKQESVASGQHSPAVFYRFIVPIINCQLSIKRMFPVSPIDNRESLISSCVSIRISLAAA